MKNERLYFLFHRYLEQNCTAEEEMEFMQLFADPSNEEEREKLISECFDSLPEDFQLSEPDANKIFDQIVDKPVRRLFPSFMKHQEILRWSGIAAAAIFILITVAVVMFPGKSQSEFNQVLEMAKEKIKEKPLYKNDVGSGGNKATLTLADGMEIVLGDVSEGALAQQGNTTIIKLDSGRLAYDVQAVSKASSEIILYNTLNTPRGGQYSVTLPDGTLVLLNASTSLRFPTAFTGNERKVEIEGEAYFEVAKNARMPFIVKAGNEEIKVLGTHFNVTAYADDRMTKTTLLEGSVQVSLTHSSKSEAEKSVITLRPGQQSQLDLNNKLSVVTADLKEAVAWMNGYFSFNDENIESIMLKISRWYDVKVIYQTSPENQNFTAYISKARNISEVLTMLELTNAVRFKIENRTITVMPRSTTE